MSSPSKLEDKCELLEYQSKILNVQHFRPQEHQGMVLVKGVFPLSGFPD